MSNFLPTSSASWMVSVVVVDWLSVLADESVAVETGNEYGLLVNEWHGPKKKHALYTTLESLQVSNLATQLRIFSFELADTVHVNVKSEARGVLAENWCVRRSIVRSVQSIERKEGGWRAI
ncbi:hypothetical protein DL96DRAFT_875809 [Flagelloscypha sp. PMI_526]|nr:hypothetical protein DL96DRAFT_875809 [Flagelloscypha sp. PMI_526]